MSRAGAKLRIVTSERLAASTVKPTTVTLKLQGSKVPAKVTLAKAGRVIIVNPAADLQPGRYVLKVRTTVSDQSGNGWDQKRASGRPAPQARLPRLRGHRPGCDRGHRPLIDPICGPRMRE